MRTKMWAAMVVALGASALVALPSSAEPGEQGGHAGDSDDHGKHERDRGDHDKDRDARAHEDRDSKGKEGDDEERAAGERKEFRRGLFERREKDIVERLNHDRIALSDDVKQAVQLHWSRLARLLRIRELALAAKEDALAKHVDEVIDREDKGFSARLDKLRDKVSGEAGAK